LPSAAAHVAAEADRVEWFVVEEPSRMAMG
jgi:hypothetical protein